MIVFNKPAFLGTEEKYMQQVYQNRKFCGDGEFTARCHKWFEENLPCKKALLTTSCTHALEMAALLTDIQAGDEVILPSYTFVSTANAFALRGAKLVFVDVRPDTMNIDERKIEGAITAKTKAIVPVHYAGVVCEMDTIMGIAKRHNLLVIEDAAQAIMSSYKGRRAGTIGHLGCFSFHETKNITCGEGGALIINKEACIERAEIIREKGTDRTRFYRGQIDKYTWQDLGSSYLPSELNAAYLLAQLENAALITEDRCRSWQRYWDGLQVLRGTLELPELPNDVRHNGHMFYVKVKGAEDRPRLMEFLKEQGVNTTFHYIPLHSAPHGKRVGRMSGVDEWTTYGSQRLLRLPIYYQMTADEVDKVIERISRFFRQ